jgi:predicted dienelactone hydrolase
MGHPFAALWVALASVAACSSSTPADDRVGTDAATTTASDAPASTVAAPSPASVVEDQGGGRFAITYVDVAGAPRTVLVEMRRPARATGPAPVVVWSHGGTTGKRSTAQVGDGWGRVFNRAGFAFVAIAHPGRDADSRDGLCAELEVDDCGSFMHLDWDRPADVRVVLDWLPGPFADRLDLDRLVYGGHSAGGRSVLRIAGADIPFAGDRRPEPDRRFAAFLIASPPGAVHLGAASLDGVDAPLLIMSGAGDSTLGTSADDRRATMSMLPDGDHVGIWVDDTHVRHTTLDLDTRACERSGATPERCRELVRGLGQAGTQFVQFALDGRSIDDFRAIAADRLPAGFELH